MYAYLARPLPSNRNFLRTNVFATVWVLWPGPTSN